MDVASIEVADVVGVEPLVVGVVAEVVRVIADVVGVVVDAVGVGLLVVPVMVDDECVMVLVDALGGADRVFAASVPASPAVVAVLPEQALRAATSPKAADFRRPSREHRLP